MELARSGPLAAWCLVVLLSAPEPARGSPSSTPEAPGTAETAAPPSPAAVAGCKLFQPGAKELPSSDCTACHSAGHGASVMASSHPVGVEYGGAQARRPTVLRPGTDVAGRGVLLPKGNVECVTCHDAESPWANRIVLPRGAPAIPRATPRDASAASRPRNWRMADPKAPPPPAGSAVLSAPLCAACHTTSD